MAGRGSRLRRGRAAVWEGDGCATSPVAGFDASGPREPAPLRVVPPPRGDGAPEDQAPLDLRAIDGLRRTYEPSYSPWQSLGPSRPQTVLLRLAPTLSS